MNKSKIYIALVLAFCSIYTYGTEQEAGNGNTEVMPLDTSSLRLSSSVKSILSMGIDMPVFLASEDDLFGTDSIVIGSANFYLSDDSLIVKSFSLRPNEKGVELSAEIREKLKALKNEKLSDNKEVVIDESSRIVFDLDKMRLTLKVSRSAFGVKELTKSAFLAPASVNDLSGVLNYHLNANHTMGELDNTTSMYLGFNSILSMGENHLLLDGSLYSPQTSGGDSLSLDRVMYERDFEGRRLALGMMDSWALQSLGQVSTLSGTQMYGFSYGNVSSSYKADASQSLTPINVYFPSAGEARVYRDGRLLSSQQKFMGNHELDARSLPGGVYDVQVDVVVAGKVVSSGTFRVNKPVNYGLRNDELNWQVWGGLGRESSAYHSATNESESNRMLAGVSVAGRTWDAAWSASLYFNQGTWVEEATVARTFFETLQFNLQNVYASDGMRRTLGTVSLPLFSNLGTISYSREGGACRQPAEVHG